MSKVNLTDLANLQNENTAVAAINANNALIETGFDNTLSRDGTSPNTMESQIDMNSNRIINLPAAANGSEPVTLTVFNAAVIGAGNVPVGGSTGQILAKNSGADYDTKWENETAALTAGTNIAITGSSPAIISTVASPTFTGVNVSGLNVSQSVQTDGSKNLVSLANNGTGNNVLTTTPTLVTPILGVATATSINKVAITAPATSATLTIPDGVTLTGPAASGTAMTLGNNETVTGVKTFGAAGNVGKLVVAGTTSGTTVLNATAAASGTLTLPAATDTLIGKATTDILTNKTYDTAGTGNSFSINGVAATANTGTGSVVRATTPTLVTPVLGAATATTVAFSPTTGGIIGTATNDNTNAGNVGEYMSSTVVAGSAVALTTGTVANVTSITLTAGDWDIRAVVHYTGGATTTVAFLDSSINTVSATTNTAPGFRGSFNANNATIFNNVDQTTPITPTRVSITGSTQYFLTARSNFAVSTAAAYGLISARRVR